MTSAGLLAEVYSVGGALALDGDGDGVRYRIPVDASPDLLPRLRAALPDLLAELRVRAAPRVDERLGLIWPFGPPGSGWWDGGPTIAEAFDNLGASEEVRRQHVPPWQLEPFPGDVVR